MNWTKETLLAHLPSVYRERDAEIARRDGLSEGPLLALLGVMARQITAVEENTGQLYDNWFVETCEPWVLPYIAELLGVQNLPVTDSSVFTPRAYVANTIHYRRRKGTPGMLPQIARDTTGWYAVAVEYFFHLCQTQHLNRHRPSEWLCPDIRDTNVLELLPTPYTRTNRLPELRNIDGPTQGRFNIPNIGLHVWPLNAFCPPDATGEPTDPPARFAIEARPSPFPAGGDPTARWHLDPIGRPVRLFNRPLGENLRSGARVSTQKSERDTPQPLRRLVLHNELESLRQAIVDGGNPAALRSTLEYMGSKRPVVQLFVDDEPDPVPPEEIQIVNFEHGWPVPNATRSYSPSNGGAAVDLPIRCALDPVTGQIAFAPDHEPRQLRAVHAYGFSAEIGGGPYDRTGEMENDPEHPVAWQIGVSRLNAPVPGLVVATLAEAVAAWNAQPAGTRGLICIMDSMRYEESLTGADRIEIPAGSQLTLIAADWPAVETDPGVFERFVGNYSPTLLRPHIAGEITIAGTAAEGAKDAGSCQLEGLLIEGPVSILPGHLGTFTLAHCTLPESLGQPLRIDAAANAENSNLSLIIRQARLAQIECPADIETITVADSFIGQPSSPAEPAISAPDAALVLQMSTLWGGVTCREIEASECIFMEPVTAERTQTGCVRFSWVPPGSVVPRPFRCQPALAIEQAGAANDPPRAQQIARRTLPLFVSVDPNEATYGRLIASHNDAIWRGGENQRSMGAFAHLDEPLREDFLRANLPEYLRAGLAAGIFQELPYPPVNYGSHFQPNA